MTWTVMAFPSRRSPGVVAAILAVVALLAGAAYVGRASAPTPPPPALEVVFADWESGMSSSRVAEHADAREVSPGPNGGHIVLHASNDRVELVIIEPKRATRTLVLDDLATPRTLSCGCWGGCIYQGPALVDQGKLVVVVGPHAKRAGVLRARVSVDRGATWTAHDLADLGGDILGDLSYGLSDGTFYWYVDPRGGYGPERRRQGKLRLAAPRGPETARHGAR